MTKPKRPELREIPLSDAYPFQPGQITMTISEGQPWDRMFDWAWKNHCIILELDDNEQPVRAYQKWNGDA